jgi:hypothetical protein
MFDTLFIHYLFWKKLNIQIIIWIVVINIVCRIGVVQDSSRGLGSLSVQLACERDEMINWKCRLHAFVGVGQRDISTRFLLSGCEAQVEGKVWRKLLLKGRRSHSNMNQYGLATHLGSGLAHVF